MLKRIPGFEERPVSSISFQIMWFYDFHIYVFSLSTKTTFLTLSENIFL